MEEDQDNSKHQKKIKELKDELAKVSGKDDVRLKSMKRQQEIKDLKKQIKKKKYGGVIQAGKNVGIISKNIYSVGKQVGKGLMKGAEKFVGEEPNQKGKKKKVPTVEEMLKKLPQ